MKSGARCIQSPVDLSSYDPASLSILRRLDDLEQLIRGRDSGGDVVHEIAKSVLHQDQLERSRLSPCSINDILEWNPLMRLRGRRQSIAHAFPCTSTDFTQAASTPPISGSDELVPLHTQALLDNFFNHVHVKNPVLDELSTRQIVSRMCIHGLDWSPEACLTLLIFALGTIATPFSDCGYVGRDSDMYRTAESFFWAARRRLGMLLGSSSLIEAQCMLLAGVYAMCTFQRLSAWRFFMQSLACCQTFESLKAFRHDYGDRLTEAPQKSVSSASEQAIYWSAWKSERETHYDLDLPGYLFSDIDMTGYPPFFPTPPGDGGRILDAVSSETERRKEASWYFYLSEISLLRLRRRMANEIKNFEPGNNSVSLPNLATMINEHEQQVLAWVHALPQSMSLEAPPEEDEVCRFVLRGHLINVYEMLYWPFLHWAIHNPLIHDSSTTVIEFATKGLQKHVDRIITNRPGFQHRHHGTFGMIVSCTRSALILLAAGQAFASAAAASTQVPCSMPIGWEAAVQEVIQLNASWEYEAPDLSRMVLILNDLWHHWTRTSQHQLA
ncbi:hypothetical protein HBI75_079340 [Parastagonospora nodorum]|nr:hypothetical protein HBI75_079340 [Parastagonospora nodorum]KAH5056512.1 hypothetical protein HBH96_119810 [Parastagonospora nodorum]KAH5078367.1 hypothetical protein HBH95_098030 [Parastagonospora nodorum]KAH5677429.1 hypothetical protein HBI21_101430 [Parastagonospora nodorum]KAH5694092.1 hypothetical protein HBI44_141470 [Parastagonospora nodorum]